MRFGKWDPVKDSSLLNPTITIFFTTLEEIMPDMEVNTAKKITEKKGTLKLSIY